MSQRLTTICTTALCAALLAPMLVGCGDTFSINKRRVKRMTHDFQVWLSNENYKQARSMCTDDAVWQRLDNKVGPIQYFFKSLEEFDSKRAFYIRVIDGRDKEVSATKIALVCDMRQQTQEAIVDVGNYAWEAQIIWEKVGDGHRDWKISKIRDLTERKFERSK